MTNVLAGLACILESRFVSSSLPAAYSQITIARLLWKSGVIYQLQISKSSLSPLAQNTSIVMRLLFWLVLLVTWCHGCYAGISDDCFILSVVSRPAIHWGWYSQCLLQNFVFGIHSEHLVLPCFDPAKAVSSFPIMTHNSSHIEVVTFINLASVNSFQPLKACSPAWFCFEVCHLVWEWQNCWCW